MTSEVLLWEGAVLTVVSFLVGILGGFVGLALGTMRLPALLLVGMPAPTAAGTNILVSSLSALTGAMRHWREGRVSFRIVLVMGLPAFVGAFVGGLGGEVVPDSLLMAAAGALVFWQGVEFLARRKSREASGSTALEGLVGAEGMFTRNRVTAEAAIGFAVGLLGGAIGLILGSIRLPALIRVLRVDPRVAAGTNLFIGFIMGAVGWTGHVLRGNVDYPLMAAMGAAAMGGSYLGAKLTGQARLDTLVTTMGWVLLAVGTLLVWQAFRRSGLG